MADAASARGWALVRVGLLVALVAVVVRRVEWAAVATSWRGISTPTAAAILAATLLATLLRLAKWEGLVRALGLLRAPRPALARGWLVGALLGALTPLRLGELARVSAAAAGEPAGAAGRAAAGVLLDRVGELFVVLLTLAIGAPLVGAPPWICAGVAAATLASGWLALAPASDAPLRWRPLEVLRGARRRLDRRARARLLGLSAAAHGLNLAAGLAIYRAFGELGLADYLARIPLITLLSALPLTVGGLGPRELAAIELFGGLGYPAGAAALAAAALFFAANVLPALLLAPFASLLARRPA